MKIFSAEQIKRWDAYTIENEPVSSIDLMERAADECALYIENHVSFYTSFAIFCGPGNNGGDGLAIARKLARNDFDVTVYLLSDQKGSKEYETNLKRYKKTGRVQYLKEGESLPEIEGNVIIIDAIFGNGLSRPASGHYERVINHINSIEGHTVYSIDIPSGMFADQSSKGFPIVKATTTLTFQKMKLAFFMPENAEKLGSVSVLDIGLLREFDWHEESIFHVTGNSDAYLLQTFREPFTHKGDYGHACIIAGSYGMMGAAVLSAQGCLRSGAGKLTCYTCEKGYQVLQTGAPEAMCRVSGDMYISDVSVLDSFDAIGIGPGIGIADSHVKLLEDVFSSKKPLVIDADALNVIGNHKNLIKKIPGGSILTPHPKEFERVFGSTKNDFEARELALENAARYNICIILKGHYTFIATPRQGYFNQTGNPGMATGGSGDVLTGILTGLLAQKYNPEDAGIFGVFIHGLAGDLAATGHSEPGLIASDIHQHIGKAYLNLKNHLKDLRGNRE